MKAGALAVLLMIVIIGIVVMSHLALQTRPPAAPLSMEEVDKALGILPE